jgi:nucleotide-binding universal stress UspA family protein
MAQAETYLINSLDLLWYCLAELVFHFCYFSRCCLATDSICPILSDRQVTEEQTTWMKQMVSYNCLHRGTDLDRPRAITGGKQWLVAIDGSEAAHRGWERVLELVDPSQDHIMVVVMRDKTIPRRYARNDAEELRLRYELWRWACHIITPYSRQLQSVLVRSTSLYKAVRSAHEGTPMQEASRYTVMVGEAVDKRRLLCELCERYEVDTLVVGKHARHERNPNHRYGLTHNQVAATKQLLTVPPTPQALARAGVVRD